MSLYHWKPGTFSPEIEALAEDILGKCICGESYKARGMCDHDCSFCCEIESVERTRARVLAEVLVEIDDIEFFDDLVWEEDGATAIPLVRRDRLLALFDKGGPLDPGSEGK